MQNHVEQIAQWDRDWSQRFPLRLTKKQKEDFLQELERELQARGLQTERIQIKNSMTNRLLLTHCQQPRVIVLAHYDTPTIMPFWITWIYHLFGHTRQITSSLFFLALFLIPVFILEISPNVILSIAITLFNLGVLISLAPLLRPNPHNREDNTSGVIGLMALADWLKDRPGIQNSVQLVFLDNEEWGLLGSGGLKRLWDKQGYPYTGAAVISLDCISRGETPLLVYHGKDDLARRMLPFLQKQFPAARTINMGLIPLSDNYTFRKQAAVDISFADSALIPGGYYIPKIHAPADNDFCPARTASLIAGLTEFLEQEMPAAPVNADRKDERDCS